jgi:hypothetical protein
MMFWGWDWGWGGLWSLFGVIVVLVILAVPWLFFLMNLRGLLESVSVGNRAMRPEEVWLNFIPVFNFYWFIYTVTKVRDSVKAEYYSRGWPVAGDFAYNIGLAAGILGICSVVIGWIPLIPGGVSIAALICWIVYWLKTADLKHRLSFSAWQGPGSPPPYADYQPPYGQPPGQGLGAYPPYQPAAGPAGQGQPSPDARPASAPRPPDQPQPVAAPAPVVPPKRTTNKQCAVCDTTVAPDDKFCRGCGLPLP